MNKLASIFYLQELGLPTIYPRIITSGDREGIKNEVDSFYYHYSPGWVLRCAKLPDMNAKIEGQLPWDTANSKTELIRKIIELQKEIGRGYNVFCHEVRNMVRGGTMLVEGDYVVVEAAFGGPRELSAMFRGRRDPEQQIVFKPGMFSFKDSGKEVLTTEDLYELRNTERSMNWEYLSALIEPVTIEFSRLAEGQFYVHDVRVVN